MHLLNRTYLFILALAITIYAVPRDEMLWLWATAVLIVLGVVNLRKDHSTKVKNASKITLRIMMITGAVLVASVIIYFFMMRGFSNSFDR